MLDNQSQKRFSIKFVVNGQYVSVREIGVGGFGVVWQVYDFSLKNYAACKELLSHFSELKFVEMFYKEALIAKNIVHANIVRVEHFWKGDNGSFYILMDYVNGTDLESLIKRCNEYQIKIPWEFSIVICMSILRAIDYINRVAMDPITNKPYGIVYRDISPGNVLLSFEGNIKLSDFGIAKTADDLNTNLNDSILTGKYSYMSPEQIKGSKDIDHRSDIFSTAVVLYEMLTGKQLFSGTISEVTSCVLNREFHGTLLDGLDLPTEIGEILSKALQIDKTVRYERAIEMYRDLRRILKGIGEEDIISDFSSFILKIMEKEFNDSVTLSNFVKTIDMNMIKNDPSVIKINTTDFVAGQTNVGTRTPDAKQVDSENNKNGQTKYSQQQSQVESKGETIFEEVDDWFKKKIVNLKGILIKTLIGILVLLFAFLVSDIFLQITPIGEYIYTRINPSDVIITTVPEDAVVSLKTKEGNTIIENTSSRKPIALRKIHPGSYVVTAVKSGFSPIQRVITIENKSHKEQEKIELVLDVDLNVISYPSNADVYVDGNKVGNTPCKVQLSAGGAHALRLSLPGFSDLGSDAKEFKEGQCNIDLTKSSQEEIFAGVDKEFWDILLESQGNDQLFSISGHFYKKITFDTNPKNMTLQIYGESKPRGITPVIVRLKEGDYKIEILDINGKYSEVVEEIKVSSSTQEQQIIDMRKLVTFRVKAKNSSVFFKAQLQIERKLPEGDIRMQSSNIVKSDSQIKESEVLKDNNLPNQEINASSNVAVNVENVDLGESSYTSSTNVVNNENFQQPIDLQTDVNKNKTLNVENQVVTSTDNIHLQNSSSTSNTENAQHQAIQEVAEESSENELDSDTIHDVREISANKPLSLSLPIGIYKFTFFAEGFEPFVKDDVDIEKINSVSVELSAAKIPLKLKVSYINKNGKRVPVYGAAVWVNGVMLGKTNQKGDWDYKFAKSKVVKGKIIAKGFVTQNFTVSLTSGNANVNKITLISKKDSLPINENADVVKERVKQAGKSRHNKQLDKKAAVTTTTKDGERTVVCSYCGYVNVIPKGRKLRFCLNCGKPLKY
jgi:serine/threonine protein kinase